MSAQGLALCAATCPAGSDSGRRSWGVALSDMARVLRSVDKAGAAAYLMAAAEKYAASLRWQPSNPQARAGPRAAAGKPARDQRAGLCSRQLAGEERARRR